jgi:serine/threonine protein phosphatase PrpC
MKFSVFQTSQIGGRKKNEDRMGYSYSKAAAVFVVADGLGGHPEGDMAAQLSLQIAMSKFRDQAKPTIPKVHHFIQEVMMEVHQSLVAYAITKAMPDAPSTTMVMAVVQDHRLYLGHCGDSRMYMIRQSEIVMRTQDHSLLMRDGAVFSDSKSELQSRHTLFSCLGAASTPFIELAGPVTLEFGDRLLFCTDGLWGSLQESEILQYMQQTKVADGAAALVQLAVRNGGPRGDNVTAVAVNWEEPDNRTLT